jgi:hypothetical protein
MGPVSIAERSKAYTDYDRLNIGIASSNPTLGMDVGPRVSVVWSCVGRNLALGWSPGQGVLYVDREAH